MTPLFKNRKHAGQALARDIVPRHYERPLVLGIARGGVPVACEIARTLHAPLDVLVVRKIWSPKKASVAIGALAPGDVEIIDSDIIKEESLHEQEVAKLIKSEKIQLQERDNLYKSGTYSQGYSPHTVIVVDDGLSTGLSMRAAIASIRKNIDPEKIVVAAPVCSLQGIRELESRTNGVSVVLMPEEFSAVSNYYEVYDSLSDNDLVDMLSTYASTYKMVV